MKANRQTNGKLSLSLVLLTLMTSNSILAEERGPIGIGVNLNNKPGIYKDIDDEAALGIHLQYRGDRLNINKDAISYKLKDTPKWQFEVLGTSENQGYDADDSALFNGMDNRDASFDIGARAAMKTGLGQLSLQATADIADTHHGQTVDLRFGPDPYRKHWNGQRELSLGLLAGVKWHSEDVVDYYYGVKQSEANASRAAYSGDDAITPYVGLDAQMNLSEKLTLNASAIYKGLPDEISDSPLVDDDKDVELNAGLTYWF